MAWVALWGKNLDLLNHDLYLRVRDELVEQPDGRVRIDASALSESTRDELLGVLPLLGRMKPPDSLAENEAINKVLIDEGIKKGKANQDRDAGVARLLEWSRTGNLEDTKPNSEHISNWLRDNVKGYVCVQNIDTAIECLGPKGINVLTWRKAEPTPAPKPKIEYLPNGEERLPLNVPNAVLRRASKEQAKDWLRRQSN
jgi:hypothetical protein